MATRTTTQGPKFTESIQLPDITSEYRRASAIHLCFLFVQSIQKKSQQGEQRALLADHLDTLVHSRAYRKQVAGVVDDKSWLPVAAAEVDGKSLVR